MPVVVAVLVAVVTGLTIGIDINRDTAQGPVTTHEHSEGAGGSGDSGGSGGVDGSGGSGENGVAPDSAAPGGERSGEAVPAASTGPGALDACRRQYDAQSPVLRTAARSIKQWQVHVDAMNQLVAGEITLDQASDFWNRTRIGAKGRVADFRRADEDYSSGTYDCPRPQDADATELQQCARTVKLRDRVLRIARRSIDTWAMHVRDMERLRAGKLDPAKATAMWQMSWHMGQRQIDAYRDALRRADRAVPCTS